VYFYLKIHLNAYSLPQTSRKDMELERGGTGKERRSRRGGERRERR